MNQILKKAVPLPAKKSDKSFFNFIKILPKCSCEKILLVLAQTPQAIIKIPGQ
jgi:hypothetical protein